MRKRAEKELGIVLSQNSVELLCDSALDNEKKGIVVYGILCGIIPEETDAVMKATINVLRKECLSETKKRIDALNAGRERRANYARKMRAEAKKAGEKKIDAHRREWTDISTKVSNIYIPPVIPQGGYTQEENPDMGKRMPPSALETGLPSGKPKPSDKLVAATARKIGADEAFAAEFKAAMEGMDWVAMRGRGVTFAVTADNLCQVMSGWWRQEKKNRAARAAGGGLGQGALARGEEAAAGGRDGIRSCGTTVDVAAMF